MPVVWLCRVRDDYSMRVRLHLTGEPIDRYPFVIFDNSSQLVDRSIGWASRRWVLAFGSCWLHQGCGSLLQVT